MNIQSLKNRRHRFAAPFLTGLLCFVMIFLLAAPMQIQAAAKTETHTFTFYSKASKQPISILAGYESANLHLIGVASKTTKVTKLNSTDPSVGTLVVKRGKGQASKMQGIFLQAKKAGKTTVSYKMGKTTIKYNIVVKSYKNPLSSLKLNGKELASKFKKNNVVYLPYRQYANKKLKLTYKAQNKKCVLSANYLEKTSDMKADLVRNGKTFKVTKKNSCLILSAGTTNNSYQKTLMIIFR